MKSILITGGTGSFGNAFVRHILATNKPDRLVIFSRDEQKQETMDHQLRDVPGYECLRFFLGDVRDKDRLEFAMHGIDTVIHAAALKIVPIAEYNPTECIATNVRGAENVVKAAIKSGVQRVIALSTDKAVNPINLYGASKLAAEKIFIAANSLAAGRCQFSVVRYGNVVGSRGSVVPLFKKLVSTGSLPITDTRMTRFWITLDQAVRMVDWVADNMHGREIFIPRIPSIKIIDLATAIGGNDIKLDIIGIRPGEKIHESLITEDESMSCSDHKDYYIILPLENPFRESFRYTSDTNDNWLSVEQIKETI